MADETKKPEESKVVNAYKALVTFDGNVKGDVFEPDYDAHTLLTHIRQGRLEKQPGDAKLTRVKRNQTDLDKLKTENEALRNEIAELKKAAVLKEKK